MKSLIENTIHLFEYYKSIGEKAMAQTNDEALCWAPNAKSNSVHVIVKHLHGNMLSRWTDFLTTDGEKPWRNRDNEFEESNCTRSDMMKMWDEVGDVYIAALRALKPEDLERTIYIRNMGQSVEDAIVRQLAHYAYHVGQIVYLARMTNTGDWTSLSIPKGNSETYNKEKFEQKKRLEHFTKDILNK